MAHVSSKVLSSLLVIALLGLSRAARADEPTVPSATVPSADPVAVASEPTSAPAAPLALAEPAPIVVMVEPPPVQVVFAEARPEAKSGEAAARQSSWYGYQGMMVDGAAAALIVGGAKTEMPHLFALSFATYALGAPIVHLVHGSPGKFVADLGIRLGAPVVGGLTGAGIVCLVDGSCASIDAAIGGGLGIIAGGVAAMVIDYAALSHEPKKEEKWDGKARISPTVAATPSGGSVGVGGAF